MNRANSFILRIHQLHCRTPVDERPGQVHRGVTAEKVQEFFRRVHDDTARELNNPVNYQGWDGTNCVSKLLLNFLFPFILLFDYLQRIFPHVTQGGIKRIVFTAQHGNYTLTGIYCFLVVSYMFSIHFLKFNFFLF